MTMAQNRNAAVAGTVAKIREIEAGQGVTRAALERIRDELIALASRVELFPGSEFPPPESGRDGRLYLLSEDDDHRFALYLNCATDDKNTPPHDHQTWAVVVGVRGEEHNRIYQRTDDGAVAGRGEVRVAREITVRPGGGVCLMPDDIHSIHMRGADAKMHLHMYGVAIPQQNARKSFDVTAGIYRHFRPHPDIRDARAG
ncbi:MAG: cysteine dioxygenase [Alphaproteobacteria bacterium]